MKSYTDLKQSKKLADILPHNTADNTWKRIAIAGSNLNVPEELLYIHNGDMPFCYYSGIGIPCWSLAALVDCIKDKYNYFELVYLNNTIDGRANRLKNVYRLSTDIYDIYTDVYDIYEVELIDACYEMIIKLNELKLL